MLVGAVAAFLYALAHALISYLFPKPPSASGPDEERCCVCLEAVPDTLLMDCRHLATCRHCAGSLDRCPICRHSPRT